VLQGNGVNIVSHSPSVRHKLQRLPHSLLMVCMVLQSVVERCRALQSVASVLQSVVGCCGVLQCVQSVAVCPECCSVSRVLQCVAECCSVLQSVAGQCCRSERVAQTPLPPTLAVNSVYGAVERCSVLQSVAKCFAKCCR